MTNEEMNRKMIELLEMTQDSGPDVVFDARAVALIHEISNWAKDTHFYKATMEQAGQLFDADATPADIYGAMIQKIVKAPTSVHLTCTVAGYMPLLERAIAQAGA